MENTKLVELLLTAEIFNRYDTLSESDIPKEIRKALYGKGTLKRPIVVKEENAIKYAGKIANDLPFIDFNPMTRQFKITAFELAIRWFASRGLEIIKRNPVLAYYYENFDSLGVSYEEAKKGNLQVHGDKEWLAGMIAELSKNDDTRDMLALVKIFSPEDINIDFNSIALNEE
ncbi:MAG: ATP-binding protein, partial [Candidatus Aenigmarchaeota archaeon]|nr:ATP-binding protein [Candidatus Aenigmarchaeota archaeon]